MSLFHVLYQLLVGPLELILEVTYGFAKNFLHNSGLSILVMSMTMNILLLPLYQRADAIQDEERATEQKLSHWVAHIKKTFHGDERFMMLQTYYNQNNYKPFYALKGLLPLVLEIPFFIAAYHFLSDLEELKGMMFGPIKDLGAPDGLLMIAGIPINVLPVAMTLINCISSAIYTKGLPVKNKIQLYGMALVFLVLLYGSPSGLVFYWTLNNLFSLVKNLLSKLRNTSAVLKPVLFAAGVFLMGYAVFFYRTGGLRHRLFFIIIAILLESPVMIRLLRKKFRLSAEPVPEKADAKPFVLGCIFLTILTGVLIPSAVVKASPAEFIHVMDFYSPLRHVLNASLLAIGLFVIWFGVFFYMATPKAKTAFSFCVWLLSGIAVVDYMFFGTDLGTLSPELVFDTAPSFSRAETMLNSGVLIALILLLIIVWKSRKKLVQIIYAAILIAVFCMSAANIYNIQAAMPAIKATAQNASEEKFHFSLSTEGENVVVLMMDRAISSYIPYFFQEKPELERQFAGFTYYPNTISFGGKTRYGSPPLYGGYEYTPEKMNQRADESIPSKHDEALKVMPVIFDGEGYEVTVCDLSYAGHSEIPDLSIFDEYPAVHRYLAEHGQFFLLSSEESIAQMNELWERNFFCYSIMKIAPLLVQPNIYQGGSYFYLTQTIQVEKSMSEATGINQRFMYSYSVLCALPDVTQIDASDKNTFMLMANGTPHEAALLQEPEYEPSATVDNREYDREHADRFVINGKAMRVQSVYEMKNYQSNMAAMIQLGRWFDYLRENGVYDNTRIIIVADHGYEGGQFDNLKFGSEPQEDVMYYNPLLMVKDFDSKDFSTDNRFMTNADVPVLAMSGLISDPVNPFTGKPIDSSAKEEPVQHIYASTALQSLLDERNTFLPDEWYSVHDDIFDMNNWEILGKH